MRKLNNDITTVWLDEIDSTNRFALDCFEEFPDATCILAGTQTSGRGRRGRSWHSPADVNFYGSFILKNISFPVFHASFICALAGIDVLREYAPSLEFRLKWPNDIYCDGKKIAGILCETKSGSGSAIAGIVAGTGINLNMDKDEIAATGANATSLMNESGKRINVKDFSGRMIHRLMELYTEAVTEGTARIYAEWKAENFIIGRDIELYADHNNIISGTVSDISWTGELILETSTGTRRLHSGDVSVKMS